MVAFKESKLGLELPGILISASLWKYISWRGKGGTERCTNRILETFIRCLQLYTMAAYPVMQRSISQWKSI